MAKAPTCATCAAVGVSDKSISIRRYWVDAHDVRGEFYDNEGKYHSRKWQPEGYYKRYTCVQGHLVKETFHTASCFCGRN